MTFLLEAMRAASTVLQRLGSSRTTAAVKRDWTPVTATDLAVQAALAGLLERTFPGDVLVAEESSEPLRTRQGTRLRAAAIEAAQLIHPQAGPSQVLAWLDGGGGQPGDRFWTLDPVDGTKGLLRGGQYVTALALIENRQVVLAGLACPRYPEGQPGGSLAIALRGAGAWMAPAADGPWRRLAVSTVTDAARGRLLRSVESGLSTHRLLGKIRRELRMADPEIRMDSQVKYVALAAGDGDLIIRLPRKGGAQRENIWDHASGVLLVEEAGGRCTDVAGADLDFATARQMDGNLGVLASNGWLHAAALDALRLVAPPALRRAVP
jgi:3'(2'), 5'-bisphosphate nucleotidase